MTFLQLVNYLGSGRWGIKKHPPPMEGYGSRAIIKVRGEYYILFPDAVDWLEGRLCKLK